MPENFTKLEFPTEGDIEWAFAALTTHAHDLARQQLASARSRSAADERKLLAAVDQWVADARARLAPNVEVDGSPWAADGAAGGGSRPTAPFDADLQARVAALTDRVEELTEAAVRGRKEVPCARRDARDEREVLRRKVQAALDARAERRRRRARRSLLKQVAAEPLPRLPGAERRDEQADTLNAALLDVEQLELSLPQQSLAARQATELIKRLAAPQAEGDDGH